MARYFIYDTFFDTCQIYMQAAVTNLIKAPWKFRCKGSTLQEMKQQLFRY